MGRFKEAEVGGFGNGQFDENTVTDENVFVSDGILHIKPNLQDPKMINENNVVDLRKDVSFHSDIWSNCVTSTIITNGTIVNPDKSGCINTKNGARITFGRIEALPSCPQATVSAQNSGCCPLILSMDHGQNRARWISWVSATTIADETYKNDWQLTHTTATW
jgi:hypothetical protein